MSAARRMAIGALVWLGVAVGSGPAWAGGGETSRDEAVAAVLDAAATRMKAKLEEARLLEAAGRRDEAIAALREIGPIHEAALALVRSLETPRATRSASPGVPAAAAPPPEAVSAARLRARPPALPRPTPAPPRARPSTDPLEPAVAFLLACRGPDGWFRADRVASGAASALDDVSRRATALAVVALCDAEPALRYRGASSMADRAGAAVSEAASALGTRVGPDGSAGATVEEHALVTWAIATAYTRSGDAALEAPLSRALRRSVASQGFDGLWHGAPGELDPWRLSAVTAAGLAEALDSRVGRAEPGIADALARVAEAARTSASPSTPHAATAAAGLLALGAVRTLDDRFDAEGRPDARGLDGPGDAGALALRDPWFVLLATAHAAAAWGFDDDAEGRRFHDAVLVPAVELAERSGDAVGSFAPVGDDAQRLGRAGTTAMVLLAWLTPLTRWTEPAAR
ncbi:MAG: hypothetical protein IT460_03570 [Planctomycetes bacterium]|nr:hypothetical protein [Planctomycetota bacterium]